MADFNFFLNRQGPKGSKGEQGEKGFSPSVNIGTNTQDEFTLEIHNENEIIETPNLKEGLVPSDRGGTYVRKDTETGLQYFGELDIATTDVLGGVKFASLEDLETTDLEEEVFPSAGLAIEGSAAVQYFATKEELSKASQGSSQDIEGLIARVDAQDDRIESVEEAVDALPARISAVEESTAHNATEIEETVYTVQDISRDVNQLKADVPSLTNRVVDIEGEIEALQSSDTSIRGDIADINTALDGKQATLIEGNNVTLTPNQDGTVTIDATGGGSAYVLPTASDETLGGVKIGDDLVIDPDGVLNINSDIKQEIVDIQGDVASLDADKQDVITDLDTIRAGASKGATALQSVPDEYVTDTELQAYHDSTKQDALVSGTNIKTINNQSILGEGNITVAGGGGETPANMMTVDTAQSVSGVKTFDAGTLKVKGQTNDFTITTSEYNNDSVFRVTSASAGLIFGTDPQQGVAGDIDALFIYSSHGSDAPAIALGDRGAGTVLRNKASAGQAELYSPADFPNGNRGVLIVNQDGLYYKGKYDVHARDLLNPSISIPSDVLRTYGAQTITGKKTISNIDGLVFESANSSIRTATASVRAVTTGNRNKALELGDANYCKLQVGLINDNDDRYTNKYLKGLHVNGTWDEGDIGIALPRRYADFDGYYIISNQSNASLEIGSKGKGCLRIRDNMCSYVKTDGTTVDLLNATPSALDGGSADSFE